MWKLFLSCFFLWTCVTEAHPTQALAVGEEVYRMKRMRDGGTQQNGRVDGVRVSYDRIKKNAWYFGGDYFSSSGRLVGHSGAQRKILSTITDNIWEGRIGYTLKKDEPYSHFFSFFTGYGYFHEINDFHPPTPIPFKFVDSFTYIPIGFLSGVNFSALLSMGFNFKIMFMQNAECEVRDDPVRGDTTLQMNNETNYRVDIPLLFTPPCTRLQIAFACTPFLEFRHFGGREGFPFNYIDTKFNLLGARLSLVSRF